MTTTMHSASWGAVAGSVVQLGIVVHRARQLDSIGIDWLGSGGGQQWGRGGTKETRADCGGGEEEEEGEDDDDEDDDKDGNKEQG